MNLFELQYWLFCSNAFKSISKFGVLPTGTESGAHRDVAGGV